MCAKWTSGDMKKKCCPAVKLLSKDSFQVLALETVTACSGELFLKNRFARVFYDPFERLLSTDQWA
jgi:hypothetical protein